MIPQLRTTRRTAIALAACTVLAVVIAALGASKLEAALNSGSAAWIVLAAWCLLGAGAAITGIVDAYVRPDERLELATTVAGTLFALLTLLVLTGIVVGATSALQ